MKRPEALNFNISIAQTGSNHMALKCVIERYKPSSICRITPVTPMREYCLSYKQVMVCCQNCIDVRESYTLVWRSHQEIGAKFIL